MYKTASIVDSVLEDITSEIVLPVTTGGSQNTFQSYVATSASQNQVLFDFQLPSSQSAISRKFLFKAGIELRIDFIDDIEPGEIVFSYGESDAFNAFPFNSMCNTSQSTLNTATVTSTLNNIMAPLLKLYNPAELAKYNSLCPSLVDAFYLYYQQAMGSNNNVLGGYNVGSYNREYIPRGAFPVEIYDVTDVDQVHPLGYTIKVDANGDYPKSIIVKCTTVEPLLFLSPFISGASSGQAGFLGLTKMNLQFNLGNCNKVWSSGTYALPNGNNVVTIPTIKSISLAKPLKDCTLMTNIFTLPPSLYAKLAPRNVLNYNQYGVNLTVAQTTIRAGATGTIQSSTVALPGIPSKIIIVARKKLGEQNWNDSNSFLVIEGISVNANNTSGLLSSASIEQLYNMSLQNGSQQSYYEFSGKGAIGSEYIIDANGNLVKGDGSNQYVPTLGSVLVIDPALDLALPDTLTNGSSDMFSFQYTLKIRNQSNKDLAPELALISINNGIFITENGTSMSQTNVLSKDTVLACKAEPAITDTDTFSKEVTGGSIENIGAIHKHMKKMFSHAAMHENKVDTEPAMETTGSAMSAGGISNYAGKASKRIHNFAR